MKSKIALIYKTKKLDFPSRETSWEQPKTFLTVLVTAIIQ